MFQRPTCLAQGEEKDKTMHKGEHDHPASVRGDRASPPPQGGLPAGGGAAVDL